MFIVIESIISLNNIGRHIIYLLNTVTQTDASDIRNIHNPTRFELMGAIRIAQDSED